MLPHQQRVVDEKQELDTKRDKLHAFMLTPPYAALPPEEQERLHQQSGIMLSYSRILGERIAAFPMPLAEPPRRKEP